MILISSASDLALAHPVTYVICVYLCQTTLKFVNITRNEKNIIKLNANSLSGDLL